MKEIGDTVYWVEANTHYGKAIPCPMCFGKRFVIIILGDESRTESECGMCSHGLDRATGVAKTWEANSVIRSGKITGVSTRDGGKYEVGYRTVSAHECFDSEAEANPVMEEKLKEAQERREAWVKDNFVQCKKNQLWSAGYHRSCIQDSERKIEWHNARLNLISKRAKETS